MRQISQLLSQIKKTTFPNIKQELIQKRSSLSHLYTKAVRRANFKLHSLCDTRSNQILSSNPSKFYQYARSLKPANPALDKLEAGGHVFHGENIAESFFLAMSNLKDPSSDISTLSPEASLIYSTNISLCSQSSLIPELSYTETLSLLKNLNPHVSDIYSMSPTHYLAAGAMGMSHFQSLLNILVRNVNLSIVEEFNAVWVVMLHKGGSKPRYQAQSWRCISTCPLVAKAMDLHVYNIHKQEWDDVAAPSQYMKDGSSHEVCALALTEALLHSSHNLKLHVVHTYLDTKAAFDSSLKENMVQEVCNAAGKVPSQSILYTANRLSLRKTFLKYNTTVMGPISDSRGVEQGGVSSSQLFQLTTDSTIKSLNDSGLGVPIGTNTLAALVLADDQVLLANNHENSQSLINSAVHLSSLNNYQYVPSKSRILVSNPKPSKSSHPPIHTDTTWSVGGAAVSSSFQATHLGIVRSGHHTSNSPAFVTRIAAHASSLFGLLNL